MGLLGGSVTAAAREPSGPHMPHPLSRRSLLIGGAAALAGCTLNPDRDHTGPDAPQALPLPRAARTAWVFSSGGPRGFVHVGVLKALDELGLVPDLIVGASAGALVGSLYAAGLSARAIETLALDLQPLSLARWAWGQDERLSGTAIADLVREQAPKTRLEHMPLAMACVAARQRDNTAVAFTTGDVGLAVQASSAIEGQFAPVRIRGERYVDADWTTPLPVRLARSLGAQRVLAVDASAHLDRTPPAPSATASMTCARRHWLTPTARLPTSCSSPTSATGSACRASSASARLKRGIGRRWRRPRRCGGCTRSESLPKDAK